MAETLPAQHRSWASNGLRSRVCFGHSHVWVHSGGGKWLSVGAWNSLCCSKSTRVFSLVCLPAFHFQNPLSSGVQDDPEVCRQDSVPVLSGHCTTPWPLRLCYGWAATTSPLLVFGVRKERSLRRWFTTQLSFNYLQRSPCLARVSFEPAASVLRKLSSNALTMQMPATWQKKGGGPVSRKKRRRSYGIHASFGWPRIRRNHAIMKGKEGRSLCIIYVVNVPRRVSLIRKLVLDWALIFNVHVSSSLFVGSPLVYYQITNCFMNIVEEKTSCKSVGNLLCLDFIFEF